MWSLLTKLHVYEDNKVVTLGTQSQTGYPKTIMVTRVIEMDMISCVCCYPYEYWFNSTSTFSNVKSILAKAEKSTKKQEIHIMTQGKCSSTSWLKYKLCDYLHNYRKKNSLEEGCSLIGVHTNIFHSSNIYVMQWLCLWFLWNQVLCWLNYFASFSQCPFQVTNHMLVRVLMQVALFPGCHYMVQWTDYQ